MDKKTSDLILAIYDASANLPMEAFERSALLMLRGHIDFDFAIWGVGAGAQRVLHHATLVDQHDVILATWRPVKREDLFIDLMLVNTGVTCSLQSIPGIYQSRAYREHWALYGVEHLISTAKIDPYNGLHVFVMLAREHGGKPFSAKEIRLKNTITQHLLLAGHHNDRHYLSSVQAPAALLDSRGVLHSATPAFVNLVGSEWEQDGYRPLSVAATRALWRSGRYRSETLSLSGQRVGERLLVRIEKRPIAALSDRELEVAWAYASGKTSSDVALALGISATTVRTHISRIYQKLDIQDKGALALSLKERG